MDDRKQITGGVLDHHVAFDHAIDHKAARIEGINTLVVGRAEILFASDLEAGMLAKNLIFLEAADTARIVASARIPIILTCRADSVHARMVSCAVGALYAGARRRELAVHGA